MTDSARYTHEVTGLCLRDDETKSRAAKAAEPVDCGRLEPTLDPLSHRDRDLFIELIVNPPEPNAAFRKAPEAYCARHGSATEKEAE